MLCQVAHHARVEAEATVTDLASARYHAGDTREAWVADHLFHQRAAHAATIKPLGATTRPAELGAQRRYMFEQRLQQRRDDEGLPAAQKLPAAAGSAMPRPQQLPSARTSAAATAVQRRVDSWPRRVT